MLADGAACVSVHEERDTFVAVTSASNGEPMAADEDATGTSPGAYRRFQNWGSRQARRVRGAQRRFRLEIVVLLLIAMLFIGLGWRGQVAQGLDWTWSMVDASEGRLRIVAGFGVFLTALVAYRTYRRDQSWKRTQWAIDQLVDSYSGDTEEDPVAREVRRDAAVLGALYLTEAPRILAEDKDLLVDMFDQVLTSAESGQTSNAPPDMDEGGSLEDNGMDSTGEGAKDDGEQRQQGA